MDILFMVIGIVGLIALVLAVFGWIAAQTENEAQNLKPIALVVAVGSPKDGGAIHEAIYEEATLCGVDLRADNYWITNSRAMVTCQKCLAYG